MQEGEIAGNILEHDARNLRLKRRLAERGIDWRNQYPVTCRFRSSREQPALRLAQELAEKGFTVAMQTPALRQPYSEFWVAKAQARLSIDRVGSHEFTEEMVRVAAALDCLYDGWEAGIVLQGQ